MAHGSNEDHHADAASLFRRRFVLLLFVWGIQVQAEQKPDFVFTQSVGAMLNPLGFLADSRILYRKPLARDTSVLFRTSRFEAGIINEWSPADEMFGIGCNIEPIAVFNMWVKAGVYENYRLFGFGYRRIDGKNGPYHDSIAAVIPQENRSGMRITLAPSLKLKIGPVVFADNPTCNRIDIFSEEGYFYDIRTALPHAVHDFNFVNDVVLLYEWNGFLMTGLNHNLLYVAGTEVRQQKLGVVAILTPPTRRIRDLFLLVTGGGYIESDFRRHTSYVALLSGFEVPIRKTHEKSSGETPSGPAAALHEGIVR